MVCANFFTIMLQHNRFNLFSSMLAKVRPIFKLQHCLLANNSGPTLLHRMVKVCCRKCWLQFKKYIYCVIYYKFRHTFVPYSRLWPDSVVESAHNCRRFGDFFRWFLHLRLYVECSPYFYCRFVWPTDLESIPHVSIPTSIIPTKFEVDRPIINYCESIAFLSAHMSRDLVTLTFWPWTVDVHGWSRD